jgi:class 3 adenylate cyclase
MALEALKELTAQCQRLLIHPAANGVLESVRDVLEATVALHSLISTPVEEIAASDTRHTINNQLTVVIGYPERLVRQTDRTKLSPLKDDLFLLNQLAQQASRAIDAFAHALRDADPSGDRIDYHGVRDWIQPATVCGPLTGRVLVVDDFPAARDLLAETLRGLGLEVQTAASGPEALSVIPAASLDLVLLDVLLPEMNGLTVLANLKANPATRELPVLMVSGAGESDLSVRCIELGAEDFLPKPPPLPLLRARIGSCLEKYRLRRRYTEVLHAVLPPSIASPYLRDGRWPQPARHENVAILFADIAGFTAYCDHTDAGIVAGNLGEVFPAFDSFAAVHGVQKIKTIGDAFMAAAGLPEPIDQPVLRCVRLGFDILREINRFPREKPGWRARVGIHVGPVVAGILGQTRFVYDVWGNTVNFASRMESNGRENCVNLSSTAWVQVASRFPGCEHSHKQVKGKEGETIIYHLSPHTPEVQV